MTCESEHKFFDQWKPLPLEKESNCLSDGVLASLAKGKGEAACFEHLDSCEQCRTIVELLRATVEKPGGHLTEFLRMARARAEEVTSQRRTIFHWNPASVPRLSWIGALAGGIAVLVALSWGWIENRLPSHQPQTVSITYDADQFVPTFQLVETTIGSLGVPSLSTETKRAQVLKVKEALNSIDSSKLTSQQIDTLNEQTGKLQRLYNSQLISEIASRRGSSILPSSMNVESDLYTTYARYSVLASRSTNESNSHILPLLDPEEAAQDVAGQIRVAKVESKNQTLVVESVDFNRNPDNPAWVCTAMQDFSDQSRTRVQFRSGKNTWNFSPHVATVRFTQAH